MYKISYGMYVQPGIEVCLLVYSQSSACTNSKILTKLLTTFSILVPRVISASQWTWRTCT